MDKGRAHDLISMIHAMVEDHHDLRAMALCGSWARGNPRPDSDLDILILAEDVAAWRDEPHWVVRLRYELAQLAYRSYRTATYGVAWSAHICLESDAELELTFVPIEWAAIDPVDAGTRNVVSDAFRVIADKDGRLLQLTKACTNLPALD